MPLRFEILSDFGILVAEQTQCHILSKSDVHICFGSVGVEFMIFCINFQYWQWHFALSVFCWILASKHQTCENSMVRHSKSNLHVLNYLIVNRTVGDWSNLIQGLNWPAGCPLSRSALRWLLSCPYFCFYIGWLLKPYGCYFIVFVFFTQTMSAIGMYLHRAFSQIHQIWWQNACYSIQAA